MLPPKTCSQRDTDIPKLANSLHITKLTKNKILRSLQRKPLTNLFYLIKLSNISIFLKKKVPSFMKKKQKFKKRKRNKLNKNMRAHKKKPKNTKEKVRKTKECREVTQGKI